MGDGNEGVRESCNGGWAALHVGLQMQLGEVCFFTSRGRHTRCSRDWSSDVCSSDLPTSELNKKAKSTPFGSLDRPFNPVSLAIGSEATFVARSVDVFQGHLKDTLKHAAAHRRSEEHTSELQSRLHLVCRLLLEKTQP